VGNAVPDFLQRHWGVHAKPDHLMALYLSLAAVHLCGSNLLVKGPLPGSDPVETMHMSLEL